MDGLSYTVYYAYQGVMIIRLYRFIFTFVCLFLLGALTSCHSAKSPEVPDTFFSSLADLADEYYRFACHPDSQTAGRPNYLLNMNQTLYCVSQSSLSAAEQNALFSNTNRTSIGEIQNFCSSDRIPWIDSSTNLPLPHTAGQGPVSVYTVEQSDKSYFLFQRDSLWMNAREYTLAKFGLLLSCRGGEWALSKDWVYTPDPWTSPKNAADVSENPSVISSFGELAQASYQTLLTEHNGRLAPKYLFSFEGTVYELGEKQPSSFSLDEIASSRQKTAWGELRSLCAADQIPLEDLSTNCSFKWYSESSPITVFHVAKGAQTFLLFGKNGRPVEARSCDVAIFPVAFTYQNGMISV